MKKSWSANKLINFLVLSSFMLVMLFAGVFTIKNTNFSSNNNTNLEQSYDANLSSDNNVMLAGTDDYKESSKREVVVYHNTLGEWEDLTDAEKQSARIYIDANINLDNKYLTTLLKDFEFVDSEDDNNFVSGTFTVNLSLSTTEYKQIIFTPSNTTAYNSVSFKVYFSEKYNEVYCKGSDFYSDKDCTKKINSFSIAGNLLDNATIYVSNTWNIATTYDISDISEINTIYIKPYNLSDNYMINITGTATLKGNFVIDGENSSKTLINVTGKTLTLDGVTIQNNAYIVLNATSSAKVTLNNCVLNAINGSENAIKVNNSQLTINNSTFSNITNNSSSAKGGALYSEKSTLTITDSSFINCSTYINNTSSTSTASRYGGAIYFAGNNADNEFVITDSTIENCKSEGAGAIYLSNAKMYLTSTSGKQTKIANNTTSVPRDIYADIEARDGSIVYLSGKLQIESSIGVIINNSSSNWQSSSSIQLKDPNANLITSDSVVNIKIINDTTKTHSDPTTLNKETIVSVVSGNTLSSSDVATVKSRIDNTGIFNLVNKDFSYNLKFVGKDAKFSSSLVGLCLGWYDDGSTVYFDPVNGSDAGLGDSAASAFQTWNKVLNATLDNTTVKLLSTWNITTDLNGTSGLQANSIYERKIAKIVRDASFTGTHSHMIKIASSATSITISNIVLDGGSLSQTAGSILFANDAINTVVTLGNNLEIVNNLQTEFWGKGVVFYKYNTSLTSGDYGYLMPTGIGVKELHINGGVLFNNAPEEIGFFEICTSANVIKVSNLNISNLADGCGAYFEATSSGDNYIKDSTFSNMGMGLLAGGNINLTNVSINNNEYYGLSVASFVTAGTLSLNNCQISGSIEGITSLTQSTYPNLVLQNTTVEDNEVIVGTDLFTEDQSKVNITFNQNLTIKGAEYIKLYMLGSLTIGSSYTLTIFDCEGDNDSNVIECGSLKANNVNIYNNNKIRPIKATGNVIITTANFTNNSHGVADGLGGGAIYSGEEVTITNNYFYKNISTGAQAYGGAIRASSVVITSGYFGYNQVTGGSSHGGAIYANTITISGTVKFYNNSSTQYGGAIACGTLNEIKTAVEFKNNSTTQYGGAIYSNNTITSVTFNTTATLVHENNKTTDATSYGGFIYSVSSVTLSSANSTYQNNTSPNGCVVYCAGTSNTVTISKGTFTNNYSTTANFKGGVVYSNGYVNVSGGEFYKNYLSGSDTLGGVIYCSNKVTISGGHFYNNGVNTSSGSGGVIYSDTAEITGGTFGHETDNTKGNIAKWGGVVYTTSTSASDSIKITGGTFVNNLAKQDGGVAYSNYSITVSGGTFTNNEASYGGVLYNVSSSGSVSISGSSTKFEKNAAIDNNSNGAASGGVIWSSSPVTISNGTFSNNTATNHGGVVNTSNSVSLSGGTFTNNHSGGNGGVVSCSSATISGGTFGNSSDSTKGNRSDVYGGVIYSSGNVSVNGSSTYFYYNEASTYGGGVYAGGTLTCSSATFKYNLANSGGAAYSVGILKVSSGTYQYNRATSSGGAFFCNSSTTTTGTTDGYSLNVTGGNFSYNIANASGGAFNIRGSASISGTGLVAKYNCANYGGFLFANSNNQIRWYSTTGSNIDYNHANTSGSVVYSPNATIFFGYSNTSSAGNSTSIASSTSDNNTVGTGTGADIHVSKVNIYATVTIGCSIGVITASSRTSAPIYFYSKAYSATNLRINVLGISGGTTEWLAYLATASNSDSSNRSSTRHIYSQNQLILGDKFYGNTNWGLSDTFVENTGFGTHSGTITTANILNTVTAFNANTSISWRCSGGGSTSGSGQYCIYEVGIIITPTNSSFTSGSYQGDDSFDAGNPNNAPSDTGNSTGTPTNTTPSVSTSEYNLVYNSNASGDEVVSGNDYVFKTILGLNTFLQSLKDKNTNLKSLTVRLDSELRITSAFNPTIAINFNLNGNVFTADANVSNVNFIGSSGGVVSASNNVVFTNCSFIGFNSSGSHIIAVNGNVTLTGCVIKDNSRTIFSGTTTTININTSYIKANTTSTINVGSGTINFNGGNIVAEGSSTAYAIICGTLTMSSTPTTNGSLVLSGKAISCSTKFDFQAGSIVSDGATISGTINISGNAKIGGDTLTVSTCNLSGTPNITAKLIGNINITSSLNPGSTVYVQSSSESAGTKIATFTTAPTNAKDKQKYTDYYFKVYSSSGNLLKLSVNGTNLEVAGKISTNIWYFDPYTSSGYSASSFNDCERYFNGGQVQDLILAYSAATVKPTVYMVSTAYISGSVTFDCSGVILTRWGGFTGNMFEITSGSPTFKNLTIDGNNIQNQSSIFYVKNPSSAVKLTFDNVTVKNTYYYHINSGSRGTIVHFQAGNYTGNTFKLSNCKFYNNLVINNYSSWLYCGLFYIEGYTSSNRIQATIEDTEIYNNEYKKILSDTYGAYFGIFYLRETNFYVGYDYGSGNNYESNVKIYNNKYSSSNSLYGGVFTLYNNCSVKICSGEFYKNNPSNSYASVLYASSNCEVEINGGKFYDNKGNQGTVIYLSSNTSKLNITGGVFSNNLGGSGGVIYASGICNITGALFNNNTANYGGVLYISKGTVLNLYNGIFTNNLAKWGGAVINVNGGICIIHNGEFSNNSAEYDGFLRCEYNTWEGSYYQDLYLDVEIKGGNYFNNTSKSASSDSGGIISISYTNRQTVSTAYLNVEITGGKFYNNSSRSAGIFLSFYSSSSTVTGATVPNVTIQNVEVYSNVIKKTNNINGGIISFSGKVNTVIENCQIYDNSISIDTNNETSNYAIKGGVVYFNSIGTLSVSGCQFKNNTINHINGHNYGNAGYANVFGGVAYIENTSSVNFTDCTIDNNISTARLSLNSINANSAVKAQGGAIYINGSTTLTLNNTTITNNSVNAVDVNKKGIPTILSQGGAIYSGGNVIIQSNCQINNNYAIEGSAVYTTGTVTINNSCVNGNSGTNKVIYSGSSTTISNSQINGNVVNTQIISANEVKITNSYFAGNTITSGEAIYSSSNLFITDSNISANNLGSGKLYTVGANGKAEIKNTDGTNEIFGNISSGSAIIVKNNHTLIIEGYLIQYNVNSNSSGQGGAIHLENQTLATSLNGNTFVGNLATKGGSLYIAQDGLEYSLKVYGGGVAIPTGAIYIAEGMTFTLLDGSEMKYNKVNEGAIYNEGYLTIKNINLAENNTDTGSGSAIYNTEKGTVLIEKATIVSNNSKYGGAIYNKGKFNIASATISANSATEGGVIYNKSGNLSINTCKVDVANSATSGGFVYNCKDATFVVNGGTYNLNTASNGGFIYNLGTFVMNKGTITNNTATVSGGAIYNKNGKSIINNGEFSYNTSPKGSAVYLENISRFEMFDGIIANNQGSSAIYATSNSVVSLKNIEANNNASGSNNGGVIYLNGSELYTIDSSYTNNTTSKNGGVVYAENSSSITTRRVSFNTNIATENGGAIYADNSKVLLQGGTILASNAVDGGAIYIGNCENFSVSEITFKNNRATNGVVYIAESTGNILDCKFLNNQAESGAGIYFAESNEVVISGTQFKENKATNGTVYIAEDNGFYQIGNVVFEGNTSLANGAGLYLANSEVVLYSSVSFIKNSTAGKGDLYYAGGKLRIKGSTKLLFEDDDLFLDVDANRNILEPGLKDGSVINVVFDASDTKKYIGSYYTDSYITSNDLKYVSCYGYISNLKLSPAVNQGNRIVFEKLNSNDLSVIASDVVITIDGSAHTVDKSNLQVYFNKNIVKNYYVYYNTEVNKSITLPEGVVGDLLNTTITIASFENDLNTMAESINLSKESPSIREAGTYKIHYLIVYVQALNGGNYYAYYTTSSLTLSIVARTLVLENEPVATIKQKDKNIKIGDASFSSGLVTSDGYAVSGIWKISHYQTAEGEELQEVSETDEYNDSYLYKATFSPYASNLFGGQTITCDVSVETFFTDLFYVEKGSLGYFALDRNDLDAVIDMPIESAITKMLDNGNIIFYTTYLFNETDLVLNINKNLNFVKASGANIFNIKSNQTLTINVGVGNLYLYDNSGRQNPIIYNAGAVTLGSGVNLTKYLLNQNAIENIGANAILTLNGAKIYSNNIISNGSLICNKQGTVIINGGEYFANTANNGGLISSENGTVYINGGDIYGNTAVGNGGAVYMNGGTLVLNGGKIRHNTASSGGGIYLTGSDYTFNYNGTEVILNKAESGADIYPDPQTIAEAVYMFNNEVVSATQFKNNLQTLNISFGSNNSNQTNKELDIFASIFSFVLIVSVGIIFIERNRKINKNKKFK